MRIWKGENYILETALWLLRHERGLLDGKCSKKKSVASGGGMT